MTIPPDVETLDVERLKETEGCLLRECNHDYTADCVDDFRARLFDAVPSPSVECLACQFPEGHAPDCPSRLFAPTEGTNR